MGRLILKSQHRMMCGDSTSVDNVEKLCNGEKAQLIHADPPYGMGKTKDGVEGDNIYKEELDRFQLEWWQTFRLFVVDNASAYIWGNAADLWRMWYGGRFVHEDGTIEKLHGLSDGEQFEIRNEIVWNKKNAPGMSSAGPTQYQTGSERCLFFQIGKQFIENVNSWDYWEGWDEIRLYLDQQGTAVGLGPKRCQEVTGAQMYSHWFSKSQWTLITEPHYDALADAFAGYFARPHAELRAIHEQLKIGYSKHMTEKLGIMRSYFDNTHDAMIDVWDFPRVVGDERHGHATPKPVEMMQRIMRSSLPRGGLCLEPFAGSGSTLIGAEQTGRRCFTMELQPKYCDVTVKRWQALTGKDAVHAETGIKFNEMIDAREYS